LGKSLSSQEYPILGFLHVVEKMVESQVSLNLGGLDMCGEDIYIYFVVRRLGEYIRWRVKSQEKL
jgi:hypothetical protein